MFCLSVPCTRYAIDTTRVRAQTRANAHKRAQTAYRRELTRLYQAYFPPLRDDEDEAVEAAFGDIGSRGFDFPPEYAKADVGCAGEDEADEDVAEA